MNKIMNIVYCSNDNYSQHVAVSITSLIYNNKDTDIHFHIINSDFSDETKKTISKCMKFANNKSKITFHKIDKRLFSALKLNIKYITIETYFRYLIADLLPKVDKCLYIDADTIINKSIKEIYNTNIDDYYIAGANDTFISQINYKHKIGLKNDDLYVNAGVLLFNLQKIRTDCMTQKLFDKTIELSYTIKFQDQDILNIIFKDKIKKLANAFNYTSADVLAGSFENFKDALIFHYTGPQKPWDYFYRTGNISELFYYKYLKLSPYNKNYNKLIYKNFLRYIFSRTRSGEIRSINILGFNITYKKRKIFS